MTNSFLLEEYKALRAQINNYTSEIDKIQRWSLITSGAIWSWLSTNASAHQPFLIYYAPAIMALLFGLRVWALHLTNIAAGHYIARLEVEMKLPHDLGWERGMKQHRPLLLTMSGYIYWILHVGINFSIPTIYIPMFVKN